MLIYLEKSLKDNKKAQKIISFFKDSTVLEIDNYKNILFVLVKFLGKGRRWWEIYHQREVI